MKRLSFRFVRRLMLLLALVFPVVYLMGGFVAALAGSHGNVTLAQDDEVVTSSKIVDFNQLAYFPESSNSDVIYTNISNKSVDGGSLTIVTNAGATNPQVTFFKFKAYHRYLFRYQTVTSYTASAGENGAVLIRFFDTSLTLLESFYQASNGSYVVEKVFDVDFRFNLTFNINPAFSSESTEMIIKLNIFDLTQMYGAGNEPTADVFFARYNADYYEYTSSTKLVEETTETPTYSEYLFNQILGNDNIIKQWGYYALSDEEKGFAPFATLIKIVDDNFFHLGDSNDLGLFVYGYVYYALNIVAIYELVALVVMVFTIPLKLTDRFTKEM